MFLANKNMFFVQKNRTQELMPCLDSNQCPLGLYIGITVASILIPSLLLGFFGGIQYQKKRNNKNISVVPEDLQFNRAEFAEKDKNPIYEEIQNKQVFEITANACYEAVPVMWQKRTWLLNPMYVCVHVYVCVCVLHVYDL